MLDFKDQLLREIATFWGPKSDKKLCDSKSKQFHTLEMSIEKFDLINLIGHLSYPPLSLFHSQKSNSLYLGIGAVKIFRHQLTYSKMQKLLNENSKLIFLGGQKINGQHKNGYNLDNTYFALPRTLLYQSKEGLVVRVNIPDTTMNSRIEQMSFLLEIENSLTLRHQDPQKLSTKFHKMFKRAHHPYHLFLQIDNQNLYLYCAAANFSLASVENTCSQLINHSDKAFIGIISSDKTEIAQEIENLAINNTDHKFNIHLSSLTNQYGSIPTETVH